MPTINATNVATVVSNGLSFNSTWMARRDATTGVSVDASSDGTDMGNVIFTARGITFFLLYRVFAAFDTSGVSSLLSANINIHGYGSSTSDVILVKSNQSTSIVLGDFDAIVGWVSGANNEGNVKRYSAEVTSWSTSSFNEIELTSLALTDIATLDLFKVCMIGHDYDLANNEPSNASYSSGCTFSDHSTLKPYLEYEVESAVTDNSIFFGANF